MQYKRSANITQDGGRRGAARIQLDVQRAPSRAGRTDARDCDHRQKTFATRRAADRRGTLPGFEVTQWYGVIAGARVPAPIVQKLSAGIVEAVRAPESVQRLTADGSEIVGSTPEQFGAHIRSEIAKWNKLVKEANLSLH